MYYVYVHTVPNGKMYIGQTKELQQRWQNGEGYSGNRQFYKDIQIYGWNNIKHEIIAECNNMEQALRLEAVLIALLKTEDKDYGYNQTDIYEQAMKLYISRIPSTSISLEKAIPEESFFENSGLPISACKEMIDQWIFNEKHRRIAKRRLLDGLTYPQLKEEFGISERQLKGIVYNCCNILSHKI